MGHNNIPDESAEFLLNTVQLKAIIKDVVENVLDEKLNEVKLFLAKTIKETATWRHPAIKSDLNLPLTKAMVMTQPSQEVLEEFVYTLEKMHAHNFRDVFTDEAYRMYNWSGARDKLRPRDCHFMRAIQRIWYDDDIVKFKLIFQQEYKKTIQRGTKSRKRKREEQEQLQSVLVKHEFESGSDLEELHDPLDFEILFDAYKEVCNDSTKAGENEPRSGGQINEKKQPQLDIETNYCCEHCDRRFATKKYFDIHMKSFKSYGNCENSKLLLAETIKGTTSKEYGKNLRKTPEITPRLQLPLTEAMLATKATNEIINDFAIQLESTKERSFRNVFTDKALLMYNWSGTQGKLCARNCPFIKAIKRIWFDDNFEKFKAFLDLEMKRARQRKSWKKIRREKNLQTAIMQQDTESGPEETEVNDPLHCENIFDANNVHCENLDVYVCTVCDMKFPNKTLWELHLKTHQKDSPKRKSAASEDFQKRPKRPNPRYLE